MARGHIRPHGEGRWRVFVYAGTDIEGKAHQLTKVVRGTKKDAEKVMVGLLAEVNAGFKPSPSGRTFGQLLDAYLDHKELTVEASTAANYRYQASYIPDRIRAMPLARIDVETLEALYAHLLRRGNKRNGGPLAAKSVRNIHICIHGAFELARRRKWVAVNPAGDAEVPSAPCRLPTPAPAEAIPALLEAAAAQHHALPTYLQVTLCAGGRRGEIHGLRWSGIDLDRGLVVLRDTVSGTGTVKPYTKTGGQRTILIDPHTTARLRALHDRAVTDAMVCEVPLPAAGFVFSDDPVGARPWHPATTAKRFRRACHTAGLPATTRLHDLRHLMATYLIDQGLPIPVVSARLGHAQNSTTLDIYTGRIDASQAAAADLMGRFFGAADPPPGR